MIEYKEVTVTDLVNEVGVNEFNRIVSDFSCVKDDKCLNDDVEYFLKTKAQIFDQNDISKTSLIFANLNSNELILVGYYSLAQKLFEFTDGVSRKKRREIAGHHFFQDQPLPAILLGQLGKNYSDAAYNGTLISGKDIMHYALKRIKKAYTAVSFKLVYLECKDTPSLRNFYESHGFSLHASNDGVPYKNNSTKKRNNDENLIIYLANASILDPIK